MLKTGFALLAILLSLDSVPAQSAISPSSVGAAPKRFVVEPVKIGLPQSSVIAMTQTRDGYLWLGTQKGLVRFDGVQARVFDDDNTPGLKDSVIFHLFEDSQTNLWIGTRSAGIAAVKNGQITSMNLGVGRPGLVASAEDAAGMLWFYGAGGDLWRVGKGDPSTASHNPDRRPTFAAEKSGRFWIAMSRRLWTGKPGSLSEPLQPVAGSGEVDFLLASRKGGHWRMVGGRVQYWNSNELVRDLGPYPWVTNTSISAACEDLDGNLIVGTLSAEQRQQDVNDGVYWFGANGKATRIAESEGLSHIGVLSLCVDREGSLWVGTDGGGLFRVKKSFCGVLEESRGLTIQSVCEDPRTGGLWISWAGAAVFQSKAGLSARQVPYLDGNSLGVSSVFVDSSGYAWAGTLNGGLTRWTQTTNPGRFEPEESAKSFQILAIHQDRRGRLWIGANGGLAFHSGGEWRFLTVREGLSAGAVCAIADDADGNLWIGTSSGGLTQLREGRLTQIHKTNGLPSEKISALCVDSENVLWVGTDGGGLARYHGGKWRRYSKQQGLASDNIAYLLDDNSGNLWVGSNGGLMRISKKALAEFPENSKDPLLCRTYGEADGLPTLESQSFQPAAWRASDGTLWFTSIRGLISVTPAEIKPNTLAPPVTIESVLVGDLEGNREQITNRLRSHWFNSVSLRSGKEALEIHYASLNLTGAERTRFKYRLEDYEDWSPVTHSRMVRYSKLPPGDYRFQVIAANEDGVWNEAGRTLAVIVLPQFWQTWWFRILASLCLAGLVAGAVYYISTQKLQRQLALLKQQEALEKERARIARDLHDQLGANLTQVALLGEMVEEDKNLPGEIEQHARQISQTARETTTSLDEIVWAANPANDTLDSLVTYACKYAQDYLALAGLRHRLEVPADLPDTPLPPDLRHNVFLAFKESINNVVKHAQATEVRVRVRPDPNRFTIEIEDNGKGPADANKKTGRNGLRNMRKRMEDVGGSFSIGPGVERGTLVRLTVPLTQN